MRIMRVCRSIPAQMVGTLRRRRDPGRLLERQEDREGAADTLATVDANLSAMQLNEIADARQPEAFARHLGDVAATRVALEDEREIARRYANAFILDAHRRELDTLALLATDG